MSKVLVSENSLASIADAIRGKNGQATQYKPGDMAEAIAAIPTPSGTINVTENGTVDVTDYAEAAVNVPNSYAAGDEGKVVSNGGLAAQTAHAEVTQNGTIDTTLNNSVTVNVSGGGDVLLAENAYATYGSFSYNKKVTIPAGGNYRVIVHMFVNSTHTVSVNGSGVGVTSSYSSCYAYLWNFTRAFTAGDEIVINASSTGSPMVTAVIKAAT